jgi:DNA-binding NarL/FixJ family response regulator
MSLRVLIADDEELVRRGFAMIIAAEPDIEVAGEADEGEAAVAAAERLKPDVVLMDIRMPVLDGIEATRRISAQGGPSVLVVTTFGDDENVFEALRAGAGGFLLKNTPAEQLVEAIRLIARGEALLSPAVTRGLIEAFVRSPRGAMEAPERLQALTSRELDVLRLMARGLSNQEIAVELLVTESTVKTHVTRVLDKLRLRDRTQAVIFAYESGLVQPGQSAGSRTNQPSEP